MNTTRLIIRYNQKHQAGFTLIEVLVTVVILAIGLLGVASLQFMSKRSSFESVQRTTAAMLAQDMLERMRSNPMALKSYAGSSENPLPDLGSYFTAAPADCASATCDKDLLADYDRWQFEQALIGTAELSNTDTNTGGLASPMACITTTVSEAPVNRSGRYIVTIVWRGMTKLSDPKHPDDPPPSPDPYECGRKSGKYDDDQGNKDVHRRILVLDTYISES